MHNTFAPNADGPFRVYVGLVPTGYLHAESIDANIRAGIVYCGLNPSYVQKIVFKVDVPIADTKIARHAYTHPEVLRASLNIVTKTYPGARITVLGETEKDYPGHRMLRKAHGNAEAYVLRGYYEFEHLFPGTVHVVPSDEDLLFRYQLGKRCNVPSNAHEILASSHFYTADLSVYCPKIKSSVLSQGFSGALRLGSATDYLGALEVCNPQLIISDGIVAAVGGNSASQRGHELGVILIANNAVAHDIIAAQILNLDPLKIDHIRNAIEEGWGPRAPHHVETGGGGIDAMKQLAQKTRFWDLGAIEVQEFGEKFEKENPGLQFPMEVLADEKSAESNQLLNWFYRTYDFPNWRASIAKWPKASVLVGAVRSFPKGRMIYALGHEACESLSKMTSSAKSIRLGRFVLQYVQLKNGRRHFVIKAPTKSLRFFEINRAFAIGSFGRMVLRQVRLPLLFDRYFFAFWTLSRRLKNRYDSKLVITSRMPANSWWSLPRRIGGRPLIRHDGHQDAQHP